MCTVEQVMKHNVLITIQNYLLYYSTYINMDKNKDYLQNIKKNKGIKIKN
jgi:hypothetical protein